MENIDDFMHRQVMLAGAIPIQSGKPVQILWTKNKKDKLLDAIRRVRKLEGLG